MACWYTGSAFTSQFHHNNNYYHQGTNFSTTALDMIRKQNLLSLLLLQFVRDWPDKMPVL